MTPKFHALLIKDVRRETEDSVSISFDVPSALKDDYTFLAGQYLTIKAKVDGEEIRRSYSICSAPFENEWRVAVKRVYMGKFSTFACSTVKTGDTLEIMTPTGNFSFVPNKSESKSYALFAAGSGITPILSIAKTILKLEPKSNVSLIYGNKTFNSIIFREDIEALKNTYMDRLRVVHILSQESLGNPLQKGRMDKQKCDSLYKALFSNNPIDSVYICGPEPMILAVKDSMIDNGVDPKKVHFELFATPGDKTVDTVIKSDEPSITSNVSIILDGDFINLPITSVGETILDAALKVGADLPFACKGGVCCTCKAKILEGSARMDVNYSLEKDEVEAGYILTCQSHPTSEKLIVSFDE